MINKIAVVFFAFLPISFCSCTDAGTKPYIQHEVSYKKISGTCDGISNKFSMNSNTNGERYEFQQCLDVDFDKRQLMTERLGDTVLIRFKRTNSSQALYDLTIDIDTYPQYHFLTIGDQTFSIIPAAN